MSEVKVNKISPRTACGTTTLGDSGDTFTIPAGVTITNNGTQTGFGRTGAVDWQTSIKTGDFTAASGEGYFIDTSSGAITVTLPASPSAGAIVAVSDYAKTFDTNNLTVARNSSNIEGAASNLTLDAEGLAMTFVYADSTKGWKVVGAGREADKTATQFVTATGGTITTDGDFKVHTFTGPGTFCVSCAGNSAGSTAVDYVIVGGGGSGAGGDNGVRGGGGGAGGYRESPGTTTCYTASPLGASPAAAVSVTVQGYPIAVGGGGPQPGPHTPINSPQGSGNNGSNSSFNSIVGAGGGGGTTLSGGDAGDGGSGGGGGSGPASSDRAAGSGNTPPVTPAQGKDGGTGTPYAGSPLASAGGGGGGASAVGGNGNCAPGAGIGGDGGAGVSSGITGSSVARAGGGGGGSCTTTSSGCGGAGGGGRGGRSCGSSGNDAGVAGTVNTGGGGGGGSSRMNTAPSNPNVPGSAGGSGIVIIRYKFQ